MSLLQTYTKPFSFQSFYDFLITELGLAPPPPSEGHELGEKESLSMCFTKTSQWRVGIHGVAAGALITPKLTLFCVNLV